MRTVLAIVLVLSVARAAAEDLTGSWRGGWRIGQMTTYATLKGSELSNIAIDGMNVSFTARNLTFRGRIDGNEMSGTVGDGSFHFVRPLDVNPQEYEKFRGDYANGRHVFVLARSLFSVYYRDATTERTGHLVAVSPTEWVGGPSMDVFFPIEIRVAIESVNAITVNGKRYERIRPYDEESVSFDGADGVKLAGTLKKPRDKRLRHAAIVMLHGSGTSSRYGINGLIEFTADEFARNGYVTLAYDKRGTGQSTGEAEDIHLDRDGKAAIHVLRGRRDVDPQRIGIWGISQGGIIAPQVARLAPVAFIINVSGALVDDETAEIAGVELRMRADGFSEADIREAVRIQKMKYRYAKKGEGWDEYLADVMAIQDKPWVHDPYLGEPPMTQESPAWPFWRGFKNPADFWIDYHGRVLLILGAKDTLAKTKAEAVRPFVEAMRRARNARYETHLLPATSHGMMLTRTGGPKEKPFESRFSPSYFKIMTRWLKRVTGKSD